MWYLLGSVFNVRAMSNRYGDRLDQKQSDSERASSAGRDSVFLLSDILSVTSSSLLAPPGRTSPAARFFLAAKIIPVLFHQLSLILSDGVGGVY